MSAIRESWPDSLPLFVRVSATDWLHASDGSPCGLTIDHAIKLVPDLVDRGADLIDVSSGGLLPGTRIDTYPGYQVPLAAAIRRTTPALVGAVGMIEDTQHAESVVRSGSADVVLAGRAMLRNPNWARDTLRRIGHHVPWPDQYDWAIGPRRILD